MPSGKKKADAHKVSKKAEMKKKKGQIEDRTFGLKNKKNSKKVQNYVQSVTHSVNNSGDRKERMEAEKRKRVIAQKKDLQKAKKEEQDALFNDALGALSKKKGTNFKEGQVEAKGRDGNDESNKKGTSRAMKMMFQMDAQEMEDKLREDPNYVPTLEDDIEAERQKKVKELKISGKGTKVTPESFAIWQEGKRKVKAAIAKKMVERELRKKKGGKGLGVLSGRALYEYKRDLFKDPTPEENEAAAAAQIVEDVATKVQTDLFLDGDDDVSLDDIDEE